MKSIKVKKETNKTIKYLDRGRILAEHLKDNVVKRNQDAEDIISNDNKAQTYESDKIIHVSNRISNDVIHGFNRYGKKSVYKTKENILKAKEKIKLMNRNRGIKKVQKEAIKNSKTIIKTSEKTMKETKRISKDSIKASQRAIQLAKKTAQITAKTMKAIVVGSIKTIKGIIIATKALISAIAAGGWIAMFVVIIISMIALIFASIFGIFFSSESNDGRTMNDVIIEINKELSDRIEEIKKENIHDAYKISYDSADWKEIIAIYAVKINFNTDEEVMTLDTNKILTLKSIFWDMNEISFENRQETVEQEEFINGTLTTQRVTKNILHIHVTHKSIEEMEAQYQFDLLQSKQVQELLSEEYMDLWDEVIYGNSEGREQIANIALSQVGNIGGEPYWRWYGFNERHEWCAIFVSWVLNQAGYDDLKFAGVETGINYFKLIGTWKDASYIPNPGDIIFFDWEGDKKCDHVGVVVKVENNTIYTVEGNSTDDTCREQEYQIGSQYIYGYGIY